MAKEQKTSLDLAFAKGLQQAFPPVMVQLLQALLKPSSSLSSIAEALKMDPMLSGKVLHLVNAASYGFKHKITDLQRAAAIIGTSELFKQLISLSLQKTLRPSAARNSDFYFKDWRLTLWGAISAEAIAEILCPEQQVEAYLTGMLKDLPLMFAYSQPEVPCFLQGERMGTLPESDDRMQEQLVWGCTHAEQIRDIFSYWNMPESMAEAALVHHDHERISTYPPLSRCVIYATRWAELLHGGGTGAEQLIAFEIGLGADLGLDLASLERLRLTCTEKFNRVLGQLGIGNADAGTRLYEHSLSTLQGFYLLAMNVVYGAGGRSHEAVAQILQQNLSLFWDISHWQLQLSLPGAARELRLACDGTGLVFDAAERPSGFSGSEHWGRVPIMSGAREFGCFIVPAEFASPDRSTLPLFAYMLGLCFEEYEQQFSALAASSGLDSLPFAVAGLDAEGRITDTSGAFLNAFGLREPPVGHSAAEFLEKRIGLARKRLEAGPKAEPSGCVVSVPEGETPGTSIYLSHVASGRLDGGSSLLLGEVIGLSDLQSLALARPGLLEALAAALPEQICLLDAAGVVQWADPGSQALQGKNIFSLVRPDPDFATAWDSAFLAGLEKTEEVHGISSAAKDPRICRLRFSPLPGEPRRILLVGAGLMDKAAASTTPLDELTTRQDPLTGLYGVSQCDILISDVSALSKKQNFSMGILFCEVGGLAEIRENQGVECSAALLRRVSGGIGRSARGGLDYPCRYGAEQFVVVVTRATLALMESMAANIRTLVEEEGAAPVRIGLGLGIAAPGQPSEPLFEKVKEAARRSLETTGLFHWAE